MDPIYVALCCAGVSFTLSLLTLGHSKINLFTYKQIESYNSSTECKKNTSQKRRVLIVTAHPDDECMFFGPSILHFTEREQALVYLLCLSPGNYNGEGKVRRKELWESCKKLGIPEENIYIYHCDDMPDDPAMMWPTMHTSQIITHHAHALDVNMVLTFDAGGVSHHINHMALYNALEHIIEEDLLPAHCDVYCLDSVNILRKYSSILDLFFSFMFSSCAFTMNLRQYFKIHAAMKMHSSQYVWFRRLYILFSRYTLINTLTKLK